MELSDQALQDLEIATDGGASLRSRYNRLYYAVFYAAKAALLSEGIEAKTHRGTANQVYQEFYDERSLLEKEEAIVLQKVQERRDMADYEVKASFTEEDFEQLLEKSREFIQKMEEIINRDKQ